MTTIFAGTPGSEDFALTVSLGLAAVAFGWLTEAVHGASALVVVVLDTVVVVFGLTVVVVGATVVVDRLVVEGPVLDELVLERTGAPGASG